MKNKKWIFGLIGLVVIALIAGGVVFATRTETEKENNHEATTVAPSSITPVPSTQTPSPAPPVVTPTPVPAQKGNTGKTPDTPIPVGTMVKVTPPSWMGGNQEITVLEAAFDAYEVEKGYSDFKLYVKIRIKALEKTTYLDRNFKLLVKSSNKIYPSPGATKEDLLAGSTTVELLVFGVRRDESNSNMVLIWQTYLGEEEPLFFTIGEIGKKSRAEMQ